MTIEALNVRSGPFTPNGSTTVFPFDFQVVAATEVGVQIDEVNISKSLFTVTLNDDGTGEVEFTVAPTGTELMIVSEPQFNQETTLRNQGPFYQREVEKALDRRAMAILWLLDRLVGGVDEQTVLDLLAMNAGATRIGTSTGDTVQEVLDSLIGAGSGSATATSIGLFNNAAAAEIGEDTDFVFTSGKRLLGKGAAFYYKDNTFDAVANPNAGFTNNGNTFRVTREYANNMTLGASGDNLLTDGDAVQDLFDMQPTGGTAEIFQGPAGGADKIVNNSWKITKQTSVRMRDQGAILRADTTAGGPFNTLRYNPVESINGTYYATITGYFSGNSLIITSNTANKVIFSGSGLSAPGLAAGTHLSLVASEGDILANQTLATGGGNPVVKVNNALQTQNLGSALSPLTIRVLAIDTRNTLFEGGNYQSAGGYGLSIGDAADNNVSAIIGTEIRNANFAGTLGGLYVKGGLGREHQWTVVSNCTVDTPVLSAISDGFVFRDSIVRGSPTCDFLEGAFHDGIFSGALITTDALDVLAGSRMKFHNVQCEVAPRGNLSSTISPFRAHIMLRGFNFPGIGNEFIGCNFGGGAGVEVAIAGYNQRGLLVEDGYFFHTSLSATGSTNPGSQALGTGYHLYMDRDSTDDASGSLPYLSTHNYNVSYKGRKDAYDWCIGYRLRFRGTVITRQPIHEPTNNSRLLKVNYPAAMRMPHRGLWNPASWHLPIASVNGALKTGSVLNTHATAGFEVFMEHSGQMKFQGGVTMTPASITFASLGVPLFGIEQYYRPFKSMDAGYCIARKADLSIPDKIIPLRIDVSSGLIYAMDTPGATHDELWFGGMSWMSVVDCYAAEGP